MTSIAGLDIERAFAMCCKDRAWWRLNYPKDTAREWLTSHLRTMPASCRRWARGKVANGHARRWCRAYGLLNDDGMATVLGLGIRAAVREKECA